MITYLILIITALQTPMFNDLDQKNQYLTSIPQGMYAIGYGPHTPVLSKNKIGSIKEFKCPMGYNCPRIIKIESPYAVMDYCFDIQYVAKYVKKYSVKMQHSGKKQHIYLMGGDLKDICWTQDYAKSFCESIGMRLPTRDEVEFINDYMITTPCSYDNPGGKKAIYLPEYTQDIFRDSDNGYALLFTYKSLHPVPNHVEPTDCTQLPFRCVKGKSSIVKSHSVP